MDQEPVQRPSGTSDGKPKLFQNINGVIAGLTGLVVAVGGLIAAYSGLKPDKKPAEEPVEQVALANQASAQQTDTANAEAPTPEEEGNPGLYTGDKSDGTATVKIEFDGENWVLTEGGKTSYTYAEMLTSDETIVKAYDKDTGYFLRWPVEGGLAEESQDDKDYDPYADVKPSE